MRNEAKFALSTLTLALVSQAVMAQEDTTGFSAEAKASIVHDDNIYRVTDELAQSDNYLSLAPKVELLGGYGKQRYEITYNGEYAKFSDAEEADYYDHDIRGEVNLEHTIRFSTRFGAGYESEHEDPGSINRIQLDITEYNQYNQNFLLAGFSYGRTDSIGVFTLNYRRTDKDYTNNDLDYLDSLTNQFTGRFTYRIAPKTKVYAEVVYSDLDYEPAATFELDNTFKRYQVGVNWDFTNKLTGDIRVGYQDRDYDAENIRDIDGLAYYGEISWAINTYTKLAVEARRASVDSSLEEAGGYLRTTYAVSLDHQLTERLKLTADAGYAKDELVFSASREDKRYAYEFGMEYSVLRNVIVGASYTYEERDSTDLLAIYKANVVGLNVKVALDD